MPGTTSVARRHACCLVRSVPVSVVSPSKTDTIIPFGPGLCPIRHAGTPKMDQPTDHLTIFDGLVRHMPLHELRRAVLAPDHLFVERNPSANLTSATPRLVQHALQRPTGGASRTATMARDTGRLQRVAIARKTKSRGWCGDALRPMGTLSDPRLLLQLYGGTPCGRCARYYNSHRICHSASHPSSCDPSLSLFGEGAGAMWKNLQ